MNSSLNKYVQAILVNVGDIHDNPSIVRKRMFN